jgi:hypothetical protein
MSLRNQICGIKQGGRKERAMTLRGERERERERERKDKRRQLAVPATKQIS